MRRLLRDSTNLDNYLDDVLAHSKDWQGHLRSLRDFFERVKRANLMLKPTKCEIGEFDMSLTCPFLDIVFLKVPYNLVVGDRRQGSSSTDTQ